MLLIVGNGVRLLRILTSDSQDGYRGFGGLAVVFALEPFWPSLDNSPGINKLGITFFMRVSMSGSPAGKLGVDGCASGTALALVGIAFEIVEATELSALVAFAAN